MSSHSTVPFCSQELTRTAQVTVLPLGVSSTRCLCVSTGRCERRLFSEGRRERSLFCGLCYVRSCAGGPHCPWDLSLSFWHPDPLILKDLVFSGELKIICSLFPIDTCAGWAEGKIHHLYWCGLNSRAGDSASLFWVGVCFKSSLKFEKGFVLYLKNVKNPQSYGRTF